MPLLRVDEVHPSLNPSLGSDELVRTRLRQSDHLSAGGTYIQGRDERSEAVIREERREAIIRENKRL